MQNKEAEALIKKYIAGRCTSEEIVLLERWYAQYESKSLPDVSDLQRKEQLEEIWKSLPVHENRFASRRSYVRNLAAAAILFAVIGAGIYLSLLRNNVSKPALVKEATPEIKPGGNKALLTLADGSSIVLDNAKVGELSNKQGIKVSKTDDGQLQFVLNETGHDPNMANQFNTIKTPKGGQYQVRLSDGTNVWLNAESSIKIPLSFSEKERLVSITGEVYFEVFEDKNHPFIVNVSGVKVKVLGTHFNIKAYPDEREIKTTLTQGSVKLFYKNKEALLKPGEQGSIDTSETRFNIKQVDTDEATAWKNGFFQFNGTNLYTLMKQLSRWYNIEVVYEQGVKNEVFYGKIERDTDLSNVLKILKLGDVNFSIERNKLIVKP